MKFLIVGDSWGCGEWSKKFLISEESPGSGWTSSMETDMWHFSYVIPHTHIGIYLEELDHSYTNLCIGGDSNINQLHILAKHLRTDAAYDMIIWFHTEPMRDWRHNNYKLSDSFYKERLPHPDGYDSVVDTWYSITYGIAEDIYEEYKIPFTVIGGMSPLHERIHEHSFVQHYIRDWANEHIMDRYCEHPHNAAQFRHFVEAYMDIMHPDRALSEAEASNKWLQTCYMDPSFPDWGHPDRQCHKNLAEWIHANICDRTVNTRETSLPL
jgi:hypothetical protein